MKLKVCGMKYNVEDVATLQPDYLGFIFHEASPRHFDYEIPNLPESINKVGVFVDKPTEFIMQKIEKYQLDAIQLHGHETPEQCRLLKSIGILVIKVFAIKNQFDFSVLNAYEDVCDYYLFDTKGKLPGGNGYTFEWSVLKGYPSNKPYFLSGGIGLDEIEKLKEFLNSEASRYCHAIDVNSKLEEKPGLKNIKDLEQFKNDL